MPLTEHVEELRRRLLVSLGAWLAASVAGWLIAPAVSAMVTSPFRDLPPAAPAVPAVVVGTIVEGFATRLRVALVSGVVLSSPVHLYGILAFVFPGLTARERRVVGGALCAGLLLGAGAFAWGYLIALPLAVRVLAGSAFVPASVGVMLSYARTVTFVLQFLLAVVLCFQLPLVLLLAIAAGIVSRGRVARASRGVVVAIFVVAAVVTPPDVVSQLCVAVPLVALHFLALLVARIFRLGKE